MQGGVTHRLQVFHTGHPKLQWGLRTLDDIPKGTFVCSYIGHIYTELDAEKVFMCACVCARVHMCMGEGGGTV